MKKLISLTLVVVLTLSVLSGCGKKDEKTIVVGASSTPHAEILEQTRALLKEKGYTLEIKEFNDYVLPNPALEDGELDANYFQHLPYLEDFNEKNGTDLVSVAAIHYEPFGLYPGKTTSLEALADGATIAVPNDTSNEARALLLLEAEGLITLREDVGINATVKDIVENPKNLVITELESAQIARALPDVDLAVINGNFALQAGLTVSSDALATEKNDSLAAETFENIVVVKKENENSDKTKALIEALKSDKVKAFIEEKYQGSVVPRF